MRAEATSRAEAAVRLTEAARRLAELAGQPVHGLAQHLATRKAHQALDDYEDAAQRDRKSEPR